MPRSPYRCQLCLRDDNEVISLTVRDADNRNVVRCLHCGHVQLDPMPSVAEVVAAAQDETQRKSVHQDKGREAKRKHVEADTERRYRLVMCHLPFMGQGYRNQFLDIGCGENFLVERLVKAKVSAIGWDIRDTLASPGATPFWVLGAFHVLEHCIDPAFVLKSWFDELLQVGGSLIVEVPNHDDSHIWSIPAYANWHYQKAHLHYFTPRTLLGFINAAEIAASRIDLFGIQRYGIRARDRWLNKQKPLMNEPIGWNDEKYDRAEYQYRTGRENTLTSDTICVVIQK